MPEDDAVQLRLDEYAIALTCEEVDDDQSSEDESNNGTNGQSN